MAKSNNRRNFLKKLAAGAAGAVVAKAGLSTSNSESMKEEANVRNIAPLGFQWNARDPFIFCVHHEDFFPKGNDNLGPDSASLKGRQIGQDFLVKDGWRMYHGKTVPGFPGHPHRGFETITVVRKGMVDHSDSMGASGRYGDGDVQWMTAGGGVQHAEMFPLINQDKDNPMELFQIWINLPKKDKFVDPHFKMLWADQIPNHNYKDENGKQTIVEVVAGKIGNDKAPTPPPNSWAAVDDHEVAVWNIQMEPGAKWELPKASKGINRTLYFYKGDELKVGGVQLEYYHSAELSANANLLLESGTQETKILILQGQPIGEPVVQHGPFVMNTKEELRQAFSDYQQTQFGGWPWNRNDPTHGKDKRRFAKHADGTIEERG